MNEREDSDQWDLSIPWQLYLDPVHELILYVVSRFVLSSEANFLSEGCFLSGM